MGSEIGGGKLFSCSGFGFRPRPRAGVASCKCQPPTPGWWLGSGADPGTPSGLGPGGSSLLGGRERRGGHRVLAQPGPAQSSQPPRPRRIDGPPPRRQVRGLGPAEVGTRGRRGLGADWGGAAPGRSNFSGTRGRLARPGGEPGPEWGFLVLWLRVSLSLGAQAGHVAQQLALRTRELASILRGAPLSDREACLSQGVSPHFGGPRVSVPRVRWGLSWSSAGKRKGGSQPAAWCPPGAAPVYPGAARLGTDR